MRRLDKRGDVWHEYILALILGILVLGLSLYFIFHEYFSDEDIDFEQCRQSILLRSGNYMNGIKWLQENAPFKCKTDVVTIDFEDYDKAGKLIMDTMAQCWYLFGEGEFQLYSEEALGSSSMCFNCARIHFTDDVKNYYAPVKDMNTLPDVKPVWDRLRELVDLTNDLGPKGDLSLALDNAKAELEAKKSTATNEEITKLNEKIEGAEKDLDRCVELENEFNSVNQEYSRLQLKYRAMSNFAYSFNWISYITDEYADTGKTYGQYFYPNWKKQSIFVLESPFKEFDFAKEVTYDAVFNAREGDLIITVVYNTGAINFIAWEEGAYSTIIPHQTSQQVKCDAVETIPA